MNFDLNIMTPAFISGAILGAALSISRFFRVLAISILALLLIWIFYEAGEGGIIEVFGRIFDYITNNQMFSIPLILGLLLALILLKEVKK